MRISFLLSGVGYTGGFMHLYKFMDKLSGRGYQVYTITPTTAITWRAGFSESFIPHAWQVSRPHQVRSLVKRVMVTLGVKDRVKELLEDNALAELTRLSRSLLDNWVESTIVVATDCKTAYAAYALMDRTLPIYFIQHYEELFFSDELSRKIARLACFLPIELISGSLWIQKQIRKRAGRDSLLLYPGVDREVYHPYHDLEEKYGASGKTKIISYARAGALYGLADTIEAMRLVFSELGTDAVEWNVFWVPPLPSIPKELPVNFTNVRFKELAPVFSENHIFVSTYWYTGFHGAILQPMSCGTAVVTTAVGAEDVAIDGQNSLVVPPRNPGLVAEAIIRLARDHELARRLARNGISTAQRFTWDDAADNLEEILSRVVESRRFEKRFSDIPLLVQGDAGSIMESARLETEPA